MRISNIAHLYLVRLKARVVLVQELFAVLGIAVGVALLFASQVASTSLNKSVAELTKGVVGQASYQLKARSPSGFDETLVGEVQRIPGVRAVVPVLESPASVSGPRGSESIDLIATDPRYVHFAGALLRHFSASHLAHTRVIALPTPIANAIGVGALEVLKLQVGARVVRALVGLELNSHSIGALANNPIVLAPLAYAQTLTRMPGKITRLFVQVKPGSDSSVHAELERLAAGHLNVEPADYDATLFRQAAAPVNQSTQTFASICALLGFMFAFCAMLLTADLRRGLVRELRLGGATRSEVVRILLFDALVLAAIASVLGLAIGDAFSIFGFSSPAGVSVLSFAFPIGTQRIVTWHGIAIAVGAGTLATCIGVMMPARDLWKRTDHLDQTRAPTANVPRVGMLACGCLCLLITTFILFVSPQSAIVGIALLIVALLLVLPAVLGIIIKGFDRLQRPIGSSVLTLAIVDLRSPKTRVRALATAATVGVAVFGSVTIQGAKTNLQSGLNRSFHDVATVTSLWVVPSGMQSLFATVPFPDSAGQFISRLPGVQAVSPYRSGFLEYSGRRVWVIAPPPTAASPIPTSQLVSGNLGVATSRLRRGGWATLSKTLAEAHHLHIGQTFQLPTLYASTFRVAALSTNLGWPAGAIILNSEDYARAWGSTDVGAYNITLTPGASPDRVSDEIRRAMGGRSDLVVQTSYQREKKQQAAVQQGLGRLTEIALLTLVAGILATAVTMGSMVWQRRRRFARMKVQGYHAHVLWFALICESGLLVGAGCLVGATLGMYGQLLLSRALSVVTGFPIVLSANVLVAAVSFLLVTVAAAICIAIPGYRATRVAPYPWPTF